MSAFLTSCFILSAMDGKIEQCVCVFCVELSKSTTEIIEMLHEAFGEHSLSQTAVLNGIHVSRLVKCQLKTMYSGTEHTITPQIHSSRALSTLTCTWISCFFHDHTHLHSHCVLLYCILHRHGEEIHFQTLVVGKSISTGSANSCHFYHPCDSER
jgi:hypothetical protein